ncbi:MAG TPA: nucleotide sugar dehydrogenase [Candidatus Limnocylindrales bacterium]|nr:nucleotide sugar dehydrogenase [Candidatus Limnocylindrales bacterium]
MDRSVAIIGLGYVGLPLGLAFMDAGLQVVGYDANESRLAQLRSGRSPIDDIADERLDDALRRGLALRSPDDDGLAEVDAIFVCVSTPIDAAREPDLGAVLSAAATIRSALRAGQLVVLQSTTWPGTTSGPFREALEQSGLTAGTDFGLAFAPERISPGDGDHASVTIPRLVGGVTPADTARAAALLRRLGGEVHELTSADAAEMAKLLENVFRNVNIALVNQLALLCERMGLDVWEVIDAAATKPFGFMPFRPGPGVGGHCIPVDPYYLAWRARQFGLSDPFVELAGDINAQMPEHVVDLADQALAAAGSSLAGARVGVVGAAFKANIGDSRNAPAAAVIATLVDRGANVAYHDPHVERIIDAAGTAYESVGLDELISESDLLVVLVAHAAIDWMRVYGEGRLIVDTVNSSRGHVVRDGQVLRLGAGWASAPATASSR